MAPNVLNLDIKFNDKSGYNLFTNGIRYLVSLLNPEVQLGKKQHGNMGCKKKIAISCRVNKCHY